jgi:hypothetical protein
MLIDRCYVVQQKLRLRIIEAVSIILIIWYCYYLLLCRTRCLDLIYIFCLLEIWRMWTHVSTVTICVIIDSQYLIRNVCEFSWLTSVRTRFYVSISVVP